MLLQYIHVFHLLVYEFIEAFFKKRIVCSLKCYSLEIILCRLIICVAKNISAIVPV